MNEFTYRGAWSHGFQFVARGAAIHFLILVLIGIAGPFGVQYALAGGPIDAASSPMSAGPMMMGAVGAPVILLAIALGHLLQAGSYFASLRFGFGGAGGPAGAVAFGLAAGLVAVVVIAAGYCVSLFGSRAIASPGTLEIALIVLMLPLILVYALFFISQAIMAAATIIAMLLFLFVYGAIQGYPELATYPFGGSGVLVVIMVVLSGLLFWLAARFSCVTAVMAKRGSLNVFGAIAESWRMTADSQGAIMGYLMLIGFSVSVLAIGIGLLVAGLGTSELMEGSGAFGAGSNGQLVLRLLFAIPLAFLSVMLSAGIYRQLSGDEDISAEVFE